MKPWERDYPERSWSVTKIKIARECPRRYYYETFGHWKGWKRNSPEKTQEIYRLKKLENVYSLTGKYIHEEIKRAILGESIDLDNLNQDILKRLRSACFQSQNKVQQWRNRPTIFNMLLEYYYKIGIDNQVADKIKCRIFNCLGNFSNSQSYNEVLKKDSIVVEIEKDFPSFMFRDVKIYSIIDLLFKLNNDWFIVDWKTGKKDKYDPLQLMIYTMYVQKTYGVNIQNITCINEYLESGQRKVYHFTSRDVQRADKFIQKYIDKFDSFLLDTARNRPRNEAAFTAHRTKHCRICNFMGICEQGKALLEQSNINNRRVS